ncbi:MAG TPA: hypothetical protein VNO21_14170 [Polyangiaceae bacterium]|nr:hypothetical protein [Polyangiaceae bacterium]
MSPSHATWRLATSSLWLALTIFAPRAANARPETVLVHFDEPWTQLEQRVDAPDAEHPQNQRWLVACFDACDRELPAGWYRLTHRWPPPMDDRGVSASTQPTRGPASPVGEPFFLDPSRRREVRIRRNGRGPVLIALGVLGALGGAAATTFGLFEFFLAGLACLGADDGSHCESEVRKGQTMGEIVTGAGFVVLVASVALIYEGTTQKAVLVSASDSRDASAPHLSSEAAHIDSPSWRPVEGEAGYHPPSAGLIIPIFTGHF